MEVDNEEKSFVYLLISTNGNSYVGATKNLERRLRQHNKIIKGGAHATTSKVDKGEIWTRACHISGFPTWQAALQFEWRWKQLSRKNTNKNISPLARRLLALKTLLALERSTSNAIPFIEWTSPPNVHLETEDAITLYNA
jgi:predicted GIY-YIG superfamily endonuclease